MAFGYSKLSLFEQKKIVIIVIAVVMSCGFYRRCWMNPNKTGKKRLLIVTKYSIFFSKFFWTKVTNQPTIHSFMWTEIMIFFGLEFFYRKKVKIQLVGVRVCVCVVQCEHVDIENTSSVKKTSSHWESNSLFVNKKKISSMKKKSEEHPDWQITKKKNIPHEFFFWGEQIKSKFSDFVSGNICVVKKNLLTFEQLPVICLQTFSASSQRSLYVWAMFRCRTT